MSDNVRTAIKRIMFKKINIIPEAYRDEMNQEFLKISIGREKILSYTLIGVDAALFLIDTFTSGILGWRNQVFMGFTYFHVILFLVPAAFLLITCISDNAAENLALTKVLHRLINIIVLTLCSFMAIKNVSASYQLYCYTIAMLCIASLIIFEFYERLFVYILPCFVYITGIVVTQVNAIRLVGDICFIILITILALIVSTMNYKSNAENFMNTKYMMEKNHELDVMNNITEDALEKCRHELNRALHYEELRTTFCANISHELRTPLNIIFSAEQMLDFTLKNSHIQENKKEINQYLHMIKQNCYRLIRLITNLIDITKMDAGYFQISLTNCDIVRIVEDITLSVAKYIEDRNIELTFDTEIEEKVTACDPDMIERIILNLLSNAVKFTPDGGSIYVSIYEKEHKVVISVKDTGIGIPENMKGLLFERFVQVDNTCTRNREGSGIGLSIVKSLVEMHGGLISLSTQEGKGSEFIIEIPDRTISDADYTREKNMVNDDKKAEKTVIEFSDIYS